MLNEKLLVKKKKEFLAQKLTHVCTLAQIYVIHIQKKEL